MLQLVGANTGGVGEYRQEHYDEQHREPSQGAETHVRAGRCGPSGCRSAGREGRATFVGVGRIPALWRDERSEPGLAVGEGGFVGGDGAGAVGDDGFDAKPDLFVRLGRRQVAGYEGGHGIGDRQMPRWLRRYRGTAMAAAAVAAAARTNQLVVQKRRWRMVESDMMSPLSSCWPVPRLLWRSPAVDSTN